MNDIPVVSDSDEPSWIDRYDGFLIDLDGVVYIGDAVVPGAAEAVAELRRRGKKVLFLTNDPQSFRTEYRRKLEAMHIDVVEADILSAAYGHRRLYPDSPRGTGTPGLRRWFPGAQGRDRSRRRDALGSRRSRG